MAVSALKKVMVGIIDENESSFYALTWVLQNLKESITMPRNQLLIFVPTPLATSLGLARTPYTISSTQELLKSIQERNDRISRGILEKALSICSRHGINAEPVVLVTGDASGAICDQVRRRNIDLLVLGDHGDGSRIKRAVMGSLSNYCVDNAKCSLLVVKKP